MERLYFAELKKEVKKIEHSVARCQGLFLTADDYAYKYATKRNVGDLDRAIAAKQTCLCVVVNAEDVCRRVGEFFVELSAFDDVEFYAQTFDLLTIAQEVVRDCLEWYRLLCDTVDKVIYAD